VAEESLQAKRLILFFLLRIVLGSLVFCLLHPQSSLTVIIQNYSIFLYLGSSGVSLVATPDYKPAVPGLNPAISQAYSGLPILGSAAIWDGTPQKTVL
jgi:hypothetical protein